MSNWFSTIAIVFSLIAATVGFVSLSKPQTTPVAVVDILGLTRDRVLILARSDLDDESVARQADLYGQRLTDTLARVAKDNKVVILPRSLGVHGAPDMTAQIRHLLDNQGGGHED